MDNGEIVHYVHSAGTVQLAVDKGGRTIWGTAEDIANVYEAEVEAVDQLIQEMILDGVILEEDSRGSNPAQYNMDVFLGIGFKINSLKARQFRKWATETLSNFLEYGYAIDKERLSADKDATNRLAEEIREIRLSEQEQYQAIKDIFKASASDYDANSEIAREFFATIQNKFYFAVSQKTAAQLKVERSDSSAKDFGVRSKKGHIPTRQEAQVAKNYLNKDELYFLQNIAEQWMLYAQGNAMRGKRMSMAELLHRVHQLLEFNGHPVMWDHPGGPKASDAEKVVNTRYDKFKNQLPKNVE